MIVDWTRDEEAKYEAFLTSNEVKSFLTEPQQTESRSRPTSKTTSKDKKDRPSSKTASAKKKGTFIISFFII